MYYIIKYGILMAMKIKLKNYLIPQKENDFEPHLFRNASLVFLATIALVVFLGTVFGRIYVDVSGIRATVLSSVVVDLTNEEREKNNLSLLAYNTNLEKAAKMKADDMARGSYFAHTSPEGLTPWHWFREAGYNYFYAGENLAVDFDDSDEVTDAWMESPTHRANILNGKFNEIGVATAEGKYKGHNTTFVVQMFGTRAIPVAPKPIPVVPAQVATVNESTVKPSLPGNVMGESTNDLLDLKNTLEDDFGIQDFVSTQTKEVDVVPDILPEEKIVPQNGTVIDSLIVSPEKGMAVVYGALALLIFIGIIFRIGVEYKRHHTKHVMLGVLLIVFLIGLFFLYGSLFGEAPVTIL